MTRRFWDKASAGPLPIFLNALGSIRLLLASLAYKLLVYAQKFTKCNTFLSVLQGVQVILEHPSGAPKFLLLRRRSLGLNKPQKKLPHFLWYFSVNALLTCQTKMQAAFLNPSFGTAGSLLVAYLLMKPLGVSLKHWHFFKRVNASNLTHLVSYFIENCG